jgi:hypothetical protein
MRRSAHDGSTILRGLAAAALLALAAGGPARADDRDLLREGVGDPYVFIVLDTSGSMHWSPKCPIQEPDPDNPGQTRQVPEDPADCAVLCPTGDCFVQRNGDDPRSKFYQAKQALHEVIQSVDGINFGFATYNQDQLQIVAKHWVYKAAGDGPDIPGFGPYPAADTEEIFGKTWTCDEGSGNDEASCLGSNPADLDDGWEVGRARRLPKGGVSFTTIVTVYVRQSGTTYRIRYEPQGVPIPGLPVTVKVVRDTCTNANCTGIPTTPAPATRLSVDVLFNPVAEFLSWDNGSDRTNPQLGYFGQGNSSDPLAGNTCSGWDPNTDTASDRFGTYSARWPTITGDSRGTYFDSGDVIPLDWQTDHKTDILQRLAPNTVLNAAATPDFSMAPYFQNKPLAAELFLRLKNELVRPIVNTGSTPLGNSVRKFRGWYAGCETGTCPANRGWSGVAKAQDPDWGCRRKYLLVLTDGDETCNADPCTATAALKTNEGVLTYVVAFGVDNIAGNKLQCMAENGGTGDPIYPQNKDDLVEELTKIFGQIKEEASAFASAAVPSVQAEVADRIYLSSFTPLNGRSVWDGHLDAFLKPLPLDDAGRPDELVDCASLPVDERSSCHLWDAGEEIENQAPSQDDIDNASSIDASLLKIGPSVDQRRVFYGKAPVASDVPRTLRLFVPPGGNPASDPDWIDLFAGLKLTTGFSTFDKFRTENVITKTLAIKTATIAGFQQTYVLGDVFHSDPVLVDRPNDFFLYAEDTKCVLDSDPGDTCNGYKAYADGQRYRRKMLVVGSNDGQLHFFDAGTFDTSPTIRTFNTGTGRELFSFMPRLVLPAVRELAEKRKHIFGIDSTPRIDDVLIDPVHEGTPDPVERQWRTVMIGGFREGGSRMGDDRMTDFDSGYYALDVTQPDKMNAKGEPIGSGTLPDCLSLNNQVVTGCGPLPFSALLWEFWDAENGSPWDEDLNGFADLGQTWSVPTVGRIRVTENNVVTEKYVAIFGGGMDAERKNNPRRGNWLYMVDVETGKSIYKRRLVGSVAADPAAVDVDVDGFLDILYVGTSAGFLYKINLATPAVLSPVVLPRTSAMPALAADVNTTRIVDTDPVVTSDSSWDPVPIFDTIGRPIYYAPVAFYVASLNRFALTFGTGDRENLWGFAGQEGRYFLVIDENFGPAQLAAGTIPLDETDYQRIDPDGAPQPGADYVINPQTGKQRGWYVKLLPDERVITQAFGLAGVVIFSSYIPSIDVETNDDDEQVCARGGDSRIFVVYANNANPVMTVDGTKSRYRTVPEFVTNPYVEQGATKNPESDDNEHHSEQLSREQLEIMEAVKQFFPSCAKFANYWVSISGIRSDTGYERYATIPIGICSRNWKEY